MIPNDLLMQETNKNKLDNAIKMLQKDIKYSAIRMECFNKQEADEMKKYMSKKYPKISFYTTWINFGESNETIRI